MGSRVEVYTIRRTVVTVNYGASLKNSDYTSPLLGWQSSGCKNCRRKNDGSYWQSPVNFQSDQGENCNESCGNCGNGSACDPYDSDYNQSGCNGNSGGSCNCSSSSFGCCGYNPVPAFGQGAPANNNFFTNFLLATAMFLGLSRLLR